MNKARWLVPALSMGALSVVVVLVGTAGRAAATLDGGCSASGTWRDAGISVDATTGDVVSIPRKDVVDWQGSVPGPPGGYSGSIAVDLPPPFGNVEIDTWSGDSDNSATAGSEEYDLPSIVPANVEFKVFGQHTDANGTCKGSVKFKIEGGVWDTPAGPIAIAGTVVTGGGLLALMRPFFRRLGQ